MSLIPWRNKRNESRGELAPLTEFRSEVDRLFDSFLREPFGWGDRGWNDLWNPSLDVTDDDKTVTVKVEVPGVKPDDISLSVTGNTLLISGEKKESEERKGDGLYHCERRFGSFRRNVMLPPGVDPEKVTADYAHGVLTVRLQKTPEAMPKKIPVKAS
ncbi:MAG TPA: Hsp20/alpha crystallin family protein [Pirellulales bacterium]|nr:Hsp20/alpha crystallin family protein [Pirellulales bacterium]